MRGNLLHEKRRNKESGSIPACAGEPRSAAITRPMTWVYPRVCGGTPSLARFPHSVSGLSPRVRGNRPVCVSIVRRQGSIPACAGEPSTTITEASSYRVYPRVCGGTIASAKLGRRCTGLSPRVRGNLATPEEFYSSIGSIPACAGEPYEQDIHIDEHPVYPRRVRGNQVNFHPAVIARGSIPACAGEPYHDRLKFPTIRVYPRVCGGTSSLIPKSRAILGLSPRVRGNREKEHGRSLRSGSIPACAGEPPLRTKDRTQRGVYPRVCGGTWEECFLPPNKEGLSPRVRGNLHWRGELEVLRGSIPACAGEPPWYIGASLSTRVYPRVCGGTSISTSSTSQISGLSPRVRGNRNRPQTPPGPFGSIPACAGEPFTAASWVSTPRVYPRVCGGTRTSETVMALAEGLSPRVRRNPSPSLLLLRYRGSIPACAGEPMAPARVTYQRRVYPRVCGGTGIRRTLHETHQGLSPRVRGNLQPLVIFLISLGSIPACAGEPLPSGGLVDWRWVYPRVCGGTCV